MENTQTTPEDTLQRPRFRNDLVAQPIEEEGVRYVDVTDPNSGSTFRFYDVEYSIACAMDGARDIDNLAEWTRAELGIEASADELVSVINTLAELGYLEGVPAPEGVPEPVGEAPTEVTEQGGANGHNLGEQSELTHREVAAAYDQALESGTDADEAVPQRVPHPAVEHLEGPAETTEPEPERAVDTTPATPPPAPPLPAEVAEAAEPEPPVLSEAEISFAGLLDDAVPTPPPPEPTEPMRGMTAAGRSPRPAEMAHHLDDEDPTQVPAAAIDDDEDDVSVDLSAHLALDKEEVQEAVRSSRVHEVQEAPPEVHLDEEPSEPEAARAIREAPPAPPPASPPEPEARASKSVPPPIPTADRTPTAPPPEAPKVAPAVTLPSRPPTPVMPRPAVRASRPIEPTKVPPPAVTRPRSAWLTVAVIFLVAGALVLAAYAFRDRIFGSDDYSSKPAEPSAAPGNPERMMPTEPAKPTEPAPTHATVEAKPSTPPAPPTPPNAAPTAVVRADTQAHESVTVKAAVGGDVAWAAENGAAVQAGAPLVKLAGTTKWEARLRDGTERGAFYAKKLAEAQARNDAAASEAAQRKVEEKRQLVDEANKELAQLVIAAPTAGAAKVLVKPGDRVRPGDALAEVGGEGKSAATLRATFDVGAGATAYSEGGAAVVAAKSAPDKQFAAVVEKVGDGKVDVRLVAVSGSATAAPGDEVVLLPAKK